MLTFKKIERLSHKKEISLLYKEGKSKNFSPLRVYWKQADHNLPVAIRLIISVPKRLHKKAVSRNLLKRRIREAFRLQKPEFYASVGNSGIKADILLIYNTKDTIAFSEIKSMVSKSIQHALNDIVRSSETNIVNEK